MLRLILGRSGTGKSTMIYNRIRNAGAQRRQVLLVPDQNSYEAERALCTITGNSASLYAEVLTFHRLAAEYKEQTPILLHIKLLDYDEAFAKHVVDSGLPIIPGVMSLDMLRCFTPYLPPERILAFIPQPEMAKEFYDNGVGIIRLWEQWLGDITPADVKAMCPNAQVFIMACNLKRGEDQHIPLETMDGSLESLENTRTASDNCKVCTLVNFYCFTEFKTVIGIFIKNAVETTVNSDIERTGCIVCCHNCVICFITVSGTDNCKIRNRTCNCKVADSVVS